MHVNICMAKICPLLKLKVNLLRLKEYKILFRDPCKNAGYCEAFGKRIKDTSRRRVFSLRFSKHINIF